MEVRSGLPHIFLRLLIRKRRKMSTRIEELERELSIEEDEGDVGDVGS